MRIVFVDNLLIEADGRVTRFNLQPHLGLISLLAVAEAAGHEGRLYDPKLPVARGELRLDATLYRSLAEAILELRPDVVGFTSLGCNFLCTLKTAAYVRAAAPAVPILLGGPHATILDRPILERFPQFDVVARNEAETTLPLLLAALGSGGLQEVPGISFRSGGIVVANPPGPPVDCEAIPWAAYEHYPIRELGLTKLRVEAGRGCPFACTFCSTASHFGRLYRLKSAARLCAELDALHARYGVRHFELTHDLFTVSRKKVLAFCDEVGGRGYTWACSARMDCVDAELLRRMHDAGCRSIYYGVETGSPRMQRTVAKNLDLGLFSPILDATLGAGMAATTSFITGYPQESQDDQDATLDLLGSCLARAAGKLHLQLHLLTPEPGTKLLQDHADGLAFDGHVSDSLSPALEPDDAAVLQRHREVFVNHHYFARSVLPREQHLFVTEVFATLNQLGTLLAGHLVAHHRGRLSGLVAAMWRWALATGWAGPFDGAFVAAFGAHAWGHDHYLSSLLRYAETVTTLVRAGMTAIGGTPLATVRIEPTVEASGITSGDVAPPALEPPPVAGSPSSSALLHAIHDCPAIFGVLASGGAAEDLPRPLRERRGSYVVSVARAAAANETQRVVPWTVRTVRAPAVPAASPGHQSAPTCEARRSQAANPSSSAGSGSPSAAARVAPSAGAPAATAARKALKPSLRPSVGASRKRTRNAAVP
jgi:radical SAM superfamily enzyme YgiQ (UPF0313 family)